MNLSALRKERLWIDMNGVGFWQSVKYYKVPDLCRLCHKIGHAADDCKSNSVRSRNITARPHGELRPRIQAFVPRQQCSGSVRQMSSMSNESMHQIGEGTDGVDGKVRQRKDNDQCDAENRDGKIQGDDVLIQQNRKHPREDAEVVDNSISLGKQSSDFPSVQLINKEAVHSLQISIADPSYIDTAKNSVPQRCLDSMASRSKEGYKWAGDITEEQTSENQSKFLDERISVVHDIPSGSASLIEVQKAISTHTYDIGGVSMALQSEAENVFMPLLNVERDKGKGGGKNQMVTTFQQPMTRAMSKQCAGGQSTSSLSQ